MLTRGTPPWRKTWIRSQPCSVSGPTTGTKITMSARCRAACGTRNGCCRSDGRNFSLCVAIGRWNFPHCCFIITTATGASMSSSEMNSSNSSSKKLEKISTHSAYCWIRCFKVLVEVMVCENLVSGPSKKILKLWKKDYDISTTSCRVSRNNGN